ncbi:MAG: KilA-N domain-containing protein [Methylococcales bacterium]|nr:KilA-N domain-containing protein [Methylococcales bacterium]
MNIEIFAVSGITINQDLEGRFCLNDLHKAAGNENKHRPSLWLKNKQTVELIEEIEKAGIPAIQSKQQLGTFAVKPLVYAYAMWISPAFNLLVINTYDRLVSGQTFDFLKPITEPITLEDFNWRYQTITNAVINLKNSNVVMTLSGAELLAGKCFEK